MYKRLGNISIDVLWSKSFQKIFGLYGLKHHIVDKMLDVTLVDNGRTECEDRARILETEFAISKHLVKTNAQNSKGGGGTCTITWQPFIGLVLDLFCTFDNCCCILTQANLSSATFVGNL